MTFAVNFSQLISSALIVGTSYLLWIYFNSPLSKVPGPFLAKFTNLWRLFDNYDGRAQLTHQFLHEKYGQAVRIGPNLISLSDPDLVRTIYSAKGEFLKSDFYTVSDAKVGKAIVKTAFSVQSNEQHAQMLRPVQKLYRMGKVLELEGLMDGTINMFLGRLDELFVNGNGTGKICKMEDWLLFFAWDFIAQVTFGRTMGFLAAGTDHSGFIHTSERALDYFSVIGQIPALDHWFGKNPIRPIGPPTFDKAAEYCAQQSMARQNGTDGKSGDQKDMLDAFIEIKHSNPEMMDDNAIVSALLLNVLAGADTTAIHLRSVVYFTLKNPIVHKKLQHEIDSAKLSSPVSYKDAVKLPYLEAVIKESSRHHPAVGLLLERVVPETGLTLPDGTFLPPGTNVGMTPWAVHQNKKIFGQDANCFNPERWLRHPELETKEEYDSRLNAMKQADLSLGAGNRICLGRNISTVEVFKLIATLFLTYDIYLVDPDKNWHVQNSWFVRQDGIEVKFQKRKAAVV